MDYREFIDQFSILTEEEKHYQHLFEEGRLPRRPEHVRGDGNPVTLGEELLASGRDVVVRKHPCFLPEYPHDHEFLEIEVVAKGSCSQEIYGSHVLMREGDALLIAPHTYHAIGVFSATAIILNVLIRIESLRDSLGFAPREGALGEFFALLGSQSETPGCVLVHDCANAFPLVGEMAAAEGTLSRLRLAEFFYRLGFHTGEALVSSDEKSLRLARLLSRIRESGGAVSLKELSDEVHITPTYLSALIHQETGMTFSQIACKERIALACSLLKSGLACKVVASRLGMHPERFCRFFRAVMGTSPGRWKTSG